MPKYIMVFNDTIEILQLFEAILTDEGYAVSLHNLGERDAEIVSERKPDLIISDHSVLNEDLGWQFIQKLRMKRETEKIPIILATTNLRLVADNNGHIMDMGIMVLPKPFNVDQLLRMVEILIGKPDENNSKVTSLNPNIVIKEPPTLQQ